MVAVTSRVPRLRALDDAILAALRAASPGRLSTAEVALACGEFDIMRQTWCDGDHTPNGPPQKGYAYVVSCTPDFARVRCEGLRDREEPVTHVYRRRHDSQTVGPRLDQLRKAGLVRLEQLVNARHWRCDRDLEAMREITLLEDMLKEEFRRD